HSYFLGVKRNRGSLQFPRCSKSLILLRVRKKKTIPDTVSFTGNIREGGFLKCFLPATRVFFSESQVSRHERFPGCGDTPSGFISFSLVVMYARCFANGVLAPGNHPF
ncbi:unnamed protein product, partial [Ectocarpus sp. 12 AP-2014]